MKLTLETLSELPDSRPTRAEIARTLKAIGGNGNYLKSKHLAIRTRQERYIHQVSSPFLSDGSNRPDGGS